LRNAAVAFAILKAFGPPTEQHRTPLLIVMLNYRRKEANAVVRYGIGVRLKGATMLALNERVNE
jgi:hypothetical protein